MTDHGTVPDQRKIYTVSASLRITLIGGPMNHLRTNLVHAPHHPDAKVFPTE